MPQTQTTVQTISQILQELKPSFKPPLKSASKRWDTDCKHCRSLEECCYTAHRGFTVITTERGTALAACPKLTQWRNDKRRANLQEASNIPISYRQLTFKDYRCRSDNLQAFAAATELESLYLWGADGTGKTLLLSLIGNEHIRQGRRVQYATTAEMLLELRYTGDTCEERLKHYQEVPVLLLDDLGLERRSDYGEEQLYMVLDGRARSCKITVIGSNLSLARLSERYNEHMRNKIAQNIGREEHLS